MRRRALFRHTKTDSDYQAVLDYALSQGIALPDVAQRAEDNQQLIDFKATGKWDTTDVFYKFKGSASSEFKRICWKRLIQSPVYGSLTWNNIGVYGNAVDGCIDTLFTPTTDAVHMELYNTGYFFDLVQIPQTDNTSIWGSVNSNSDGSNVYKFAGKWLWRLNSKYKTTVYNMTSSDEGAVSVNRKAAEANFNLITPSGSYPISEQITAMASQPIILLAHYSAGGIIDYSDAGLGWFIAGKEMIDEYEQIKTILNL